MESILVQDNEEKQWDLYCAMMANPFTGDVGNFEEFKRRFNTSKRKTESTEHAMNNAQIRQQVEKANRILNGFVPPEKGGGG